MLDLVHYTLCFLYTALGYILAVEEKMEENKDLSVVALLRRDLFSNF